MTFERCLLMLAVVGSIALASTTARGQDGCPADLAGGASTAIVGFEDLSLLLGAWGTDGPGADIAAPADVVGFADLSALLRAWGPCPGSCVLVDGSRVLNGAAGFADDCNAPCACIDGTVVCETELECNAPCAFGDDVLLSGEVVAIDACNTCACLHGVLTCTDLTCFAPCFVDGTPVAHGSVIMQGCSSCTCLHGELDCDDSGCP